MNELHSFSFNERKHGNITKNALFFFLTDLISLQSLTGDFKKSIQMNCLRNRIYVAQISDHT